MILDRHIGNCFWKFSPNTPHQVRNDSLFNFLLSLWLYINAMRVCLFLWSYFLKNSLFYRTVRIWNTENPKKNKTVIKTKNKQGEKVLRLLDYDEDYDEVFGEVCRASHFSCISPQSSAQRLPFFFSPISFDSEGGTTGSLWAYSACYLSLQQRVSVVFFKMHVLLQHLFLRREEDNSDALLL